MDKPTLKKTLIRDFCFLPEIETFKGNSIILVTTFGIISGSIIEPPENDDAKCSNAELLAIVTTKMAKKYREDYKLESPLYGNDGYVSLKDVSIRTSTKDSTINFSYLVVFFDQIIGVSIGDINNIN